MSFRAWIHPRAAFFVGLLAYFGTVAPANAQQRDDLLRRQVELTDRLHDLRVREPSYSKSDRVTQLQAQLREAQRRFRERRDQLEQKLREHTSQRPLADTAKATELFREIVGLEDEKRRALAELRAGLYCSLCKETKTEIESNGTAFEDHLENVKGKAVAAPPDVIARKEADFDAKIERLQRQLAELRRREQDSKRDHEEQATEMRRQLAELDIEEREALAAIRRQITDGRFDERAAADEKEARWLDEIRTVEDELGAIDEELDRLSRERNEPRRNPNDDLPDQWVDEDAGVAFVRFGSSREPNDGATDSEPLMPEPYAGQTGESWVPYEIVDSGESAPFEMIESDDSAMFVFERESAAIQELLIEPRQDSVAGTAPPAFAIDGLAGFTADVLETVDTARSAIRALVPRDKLEFIANVVVEGTPAFIEAREDVLYRDLSPERRFEREEPTRTGTAPVFGVDGFLGWTGDWVDFAARSIVRYFRSFDALPDYIGVDDP